MKHIWGFGSFQIRSDSIGVQMTNAVCSMYYKRIYIQNKNVVNYIYQTQPKYRPYFNIEFDLLTNDDVYKFQDIIAILNNYQTDGMYIYCNFNVYNEDNTQFAVVLEQFSVQDISDTVGQHITMKFIGQYADASMITYLSD